MTARRTFIPAALSALLVAGVVAAQPPARSPHPRPLPNPPRPLYPPAPPATYPIDLPTALQLADASNPTVGIARARVREALARLDQVRVMWIPTLSFGPTVFYHD